MKFAHVVTKWIGEGTSDDKWRADMPEGYTGMSVLLNQYVNLAMDCPSPNIAVVLIRESREKHKDYIKGLKSNLNQIVLETWEYDGGPAPLVASALKLRNFLIRQGIEEHLADSIVDASEERTTALLGELELADKRSRRRMELEV